MGNHGRGRPAPSSPWAWANHASLGSAGVGGGQRRHVLVAVAPLRKRPRPSRPPRPHAPDPNSHRPIHPPMVVLARPATCCCRPPGAPRPRGRLPAWLAPPPRRWPPQEAAPWRSPSVAAARRAWRPALRCASTRARLSAAHALAQRCGADGRACQWVVRLDRRLACRAVCAARTRRRRRRPRTSCADTA